MTPYMRLGNYYALPRIASSDTSHNHAAQHRRASLTRTAAERPL